MACGMDGVLTAPLRVEELKATLGMWLALPCLPSHEPSGAAPPRESFQAIIMQDLDAFERALQVRDSMQMAHFAHRLKGAALVLGMGDAASLADRLERTAREEWSWQPQTMRQRLRRLKEALARHFKDGGRAH